LVVANHRFDKIIERLDANIDLLFKSLLTEYQKLEVNGMKLESQGLLVPIP